MGKTKPAARFGSRRNVICSTAPVFEGAGFGKEAGGILVGISWGERNEKEEAI